MIKLTNMVVKDIRLLDETEDEFNGELDVAVEFEDNYSYLISVCTPSYFLQEMRIERTNFVAPQSPQIVVKKLSKEVVTEAIEAYAQNDGYWLKLCQFGSYLDVSVLDKLENQHREDSKLFELEGLDQLFYYTQKYLKVPSDNKVFIEPIFFLILGSLITYGLLKPELLNFFFNFIH